MELTSKEALKKALVEVLSEKYDEELAKCRKEDAYCSDEHYRKMSEILGFNVCREKKVMRLTKKTLIAILIAAALLLLGCGAVIYRYELKGLIQKICRRDIELYYDENEVSEGKETIEEIYELTYIPEGYTLVREFSNDFLVRYEWISSTGEDLLFEQSPLKTSKLSIDSEHGEMNIIEIEDCEIYCRTIDSKYCYIWHDELYIMIMDFDVQIEDAELIKIINGIEIRE